MQMNSMAIELYYIPAAYTKTDQVSWVYTHTREERRENLLLLFLYYYYYCCYKRSLSETITKHPPQSTSDDWSAALRTESGNDANEA